MARGFASPLPTPQQAPNGTGMPILNAIATSARFARFFAAVELRHLANQLDPAGCASASVRSASHFMHVAQVVSGHFRTRLTVSELVDELVGDMEAQERTPFGARIVDAIVRAGACRDVLSFTESLLTD